MWGKMGAGSTSCAPPQSRRRASCMSPTRSLFPWIPWFSFWDFLSECKLTGVPLVLLIEQSDLIYDVLSQGSGATFTPGLVVRLMFLWPHRAHVSEHLPCVLKINPGAGATALGGFPGGSGLAASLSSPASAATRPEE